MTFDLLYAPMPGLAVGLPLSQISRIRSSEERTEDAGDEEVLPLAQALGLTTAGPASRSGAARVVEVAAEGKRFGLLIGAEVTLEQRAAPSSSLYRLPRLLERLRPPTWLSGLWLAAEGICLVVDLERLALINQKESGCRR